MGYWGFWLSRQSRVPSWLGHTLRWSCAILVAAPAVGVWLTVRGLETAFRAGTGVSAAEKQQRLAIGISEAMNATALVVLLLFLELLVLLTLTIRYHWWKRRADVGSSAPY